MKNNTYIHDIPGRLRIRVEAIKNNERTAAAIRDLLAAIPGVFSVRTNPLAGSVTATYDTTMLTSPEVLTSLRQNGYLDAETSSSERRTAPAQPSSNPLMGLVLHQLGQMVLSWTVERALLAAVAVLL